MVRRVVYIASCFIILTVLSCKEPYAIPAKAVAITNYLVVDGNINVGGDSTVITLSHTKPLNDSTVAEPEIGAQVAVESDNGGSFPLLELGNGHYAITNIPEGSGAQKYRLDIKTVAGKQYLSDYVDYKKTPAIDSVSWEQHADGVHIYVNTHDPNALSKYYKWDFIETWEYHAAFQSEYVVTNGSIVPRDPGSYVYICWRTIPSSNIFIQSTAKLSSDIVYKKELMFIPASTEKVGVKYSILVKQTVLTEDGFNYWDALSKNTEQLGSLFDALPAQLTGNIHSVSNATEPVIGFISATNTEQQRLFIEKDQLTDWAYPPGPFSICDTVHVTNDATMQLVLDDSYLVIMPISLLPPYYAAPIDCSDCRLEGGVTIRPPFWP